jgi:hypothetical protein
VLQRPQLTGRNRRRGGRPRSRIEDRQFAKHLTRTEHCQQVLTPRRSGASQLDLATYHDVEPVLQVTFVEEHIALVEEQFPHRRGERGRGIVFQSGKQRCLLQDFRIHAVLPDHGSPFEGKATVECWVTSGARSRR